MRGASFRDLAGADVTRDDVQRMLELEETLFVEHKGAEPDYQLAKAVAAFSNQLGGWVLVNVKDRKPLGPPPEWITAAASPVDAMRDRIKQHVDPLPPFEARVFDLEQGQSVLLVRVYESADTPHILSDGAIYVRGVAQDRRKDPIYRPIPIENQQALQALVERGLASRARVGDLIKPRRDLPLANGGLGISFERSGDSLVPFADGPLACARIAPHTLPGRFQGWARSRNALALARDAVAELTGSDDVDVNPHSQGFWLQAPMTMDRAPITERGTSLAGPARFSMDAVGLVGVTTRFAERNPDDWCPPLTLDEFASRYIEPLIAAPTRVLEGGAMLGRATCHLWFYAMGNLMRIEDGGKIMRLGGQVPFESEITLPTETGELENVAAEAARAFGREGGLPSFE